MALFLAGVAIVSVTLRTPSPTAVPSMKETRSYISSLLITAESTSPFWPKPKDWNAETAAMRQYITKMNHLQPPLATGNKLPLSPSGKSPVAAAEPTTVAAVAPTTVAAAEPTTAPAAVPAEAPELAVLRSECEAASFERTRRAKLCDTRLAGLKAINERALRTELLSQRQDGAKAVTLRKERSASLTSVAVPTRTVAAPEGFVWAEAVF